MELGILDAGSVSLGPDGIRAIWSRAYAVGRRDLFRWPRLAFEELPAFDMERPAHRLRDARERHDAL